MPEALAESVIWIAVTATKANATSKRTDLAVPLDILVVLVMSSLTEIVFIQAAFPFTDTAQPLVAITLFSKA
jgi:hypothetical protein